MQKVLWVCGGPTSTPFALPTYVRLDEPDAAESVGTAHLGKGAQTRGRRRWVRYGFDVQAHSSGRRRGRTGEKTMRIGGGAEEWEERWRGPEAAAAGVEAIVGCVPAERRSNE